MTAAKKKPAAPVPEVAKKAAKMAYAAGMLTGEVKQMIGEGAPAAKKPSKPKPRKASKPSKARASKPSKPAPRKSSKGKETTMRKNGPAEGKVVVPTARWSYGDTSPVGSSMGGAPRPKPGRPVTGTRKPG